MTYTVGYQGVNGSFSEEAVIQYFTGKEIKRVGYRDFVSIIKDTEKGILDYALLPVENTTTGIIARTYDLFSSYHIYTVGEINIPIVQNLITVPGSDLSGIREVYSHPEALSQCRGFFAAHPEIREIPYQDTAKSVELIHDEMNPSKAAIGSRIAADYYGMHIMMQVNDSDLNMTRFLCISGKEEYDPDADKISMKLILKHTPGALYNVLGILARRNINIIKLESRPIPGRVFEYLFYIDFEGNLKNREIREVMHELKLRCEECVVFGNYKAYETNREGVKDIR